MENKHSLCFSSERKKARQGRVAKMYCEGEACFQKEGLNGVMAFSAHG